MITVSKAKAQHKQKQRKQWGNCTYNYAHIKKMIGGFKETDRIMANTKSTCIVMTKMTKNQHDTTIRFSLYISRDCISSNWIWVRSETDEQTNNPVDQTLRNAFPILAAG